MTNITRDEIRTVQDAWASGIVDISRVFIEKGDYKARAKDHIETLYGYDLGPVAFKPTLAADVQFRPDFEGALSYFVGGIHDEDGGFAIRPWKAARFGEQQIICQDASALAMGNYYFTPADSDDEVKVEFSFAYVRDDNGKLRINLHHSSLPYSPSE